MSVKIYGQSVKMVVIWICLSRKCIFVFIDVVNSGCCFAHRSNSCMISLMVDTETTRANSLLRVVETSFSIP